MVINGERGLVMNATVTCPKCGKHHPAGADACSCGWTFSTMGPTIRGGPLEAKTEDDAPPEGGSDAIQRPFDIGKPLGTPHAVSRACPKCGSTDYRAVKPAAMVAFTSDRVCQACSTRYTPPTPLWARLIFGGVGLAAVCFGAVMAYGILRGEHDATFGLLTPIVVAVVGLGCLYKAATR